jgi:hypothetical protein
MFLRTPQDFCEMSLELRLGQLASIAPRLSMFWDVATPEF